MELNAVIALRLFHQTDKSPVENRCPPTLTHTSIESKAYVSQMKASIFVVPTHKLNTHRE